MLIPEHLDLLPTHFPNSASQSFRNGFFGGEPSRKRFCYVTELLQLGRRIDALQIALAVPRDDFSYAVDLDQVNTGSQNHRSLGYGRLGAADVLLGPGDGNSQPLSVDILTRHLKDLGTRDRSHLAVITMVVVKPEFMSLDVQ